MSTRDIISWDEGWAVLQTGINKVTAILDGQEETQLRSDDFTVLYTTVYNMSTQKPPHHYSTDLRCKYKEACNEYLRLKVLPSFDEKHGVILFREFVRRWNNHKKMVRCLSGIFGYLDRCCLSRRTSSSVEEDGLVTFRTMVFTRLCSRVGAAALTMIHSEREGEQIDRTLLKDVVSVFVEVGMGGLEFYENLFESSMLCATSDYYSQKASKWIPEDSCPDYMLRAEECIERERARVSHYLQPSSEAKLIQNVQHELLSVYGTQLLQKEHSGFHVLLNDNKVDDLSRMYRLFSTINKGLDPVTSVFKEVVIAQGRVLVKQAEDAASNKDFVRTMIELHRKYLRYVTVYFMDHALFRKVLKEAFEVVFDKYVCGSSSSELLAGYSDDILKKGACGTLSNEAMEERLDKVVDLLACISNKDEYGGFHRSKLARRLLSDPRPNVDHEWSQLRRLNIHCGAQFTEKMEGMIQDLAMAPDNNSRFTEYLATNPQVNPGMELKVTLLSSRFWPSYNTSNLNLPEEMVKCVEVYKGFYGTDRKDRKLTWVHSLGSCDVIGKFEAKRVELVVTPYQAAALVLFNSSDIWSYQQVKMQLNLSDDDVARILHSLACASYKILIKVPDNKTISSTDEFQFNPKFTDTKRRIKIPMPSAADENKPALKEVDHDRRFATDTALVRIMKREKKMNFSQLTIECVRDLEQKKLFKPDVKLIKKRVEDLIIREFLERDKHDLNLLFYVT